jgi:uncharacterized phage-associated protein
MAQSTILIAKNNTGSTIKAGKLVYISGFDDDIGQATIALASNDDSTKMPAVGALREDAESGEQDVVIKISGPCPGFDTLDVEVNAPVYVGQNGEVVFDVEPHSENSELYTQQIGTVLNQAEYPLGQIQLFPLEIRRRIKHPDLLEVTEDQHHIMNHAERHVPTGLDPFIHAEQHRVGGGDELSHSALADLDEDGHEQYILVDGTRAFTGVVGGVNPTSSSHLATKNYVDSAVSTGAINIDGYASDQSLQELKLSHSTDVKAIIDVLDGYSTDINLQQTVDEHYRQHSEAIQTILKDLDGYSASGLNEITFQQNKSFWDESIKFLTQAADGYAYLSVENQRWIDSSQQLNDIRNALDGYSSGSASELGRTVDEHYQQHSEAIQTILKELDGYATSTDPNLQQTVDEHYRQHSDAIQTILGDLDGYALESDLNGLSATESEHYTQTSEAIQTIAKELDGYASDQTVSEHYEQHNAVIQTIIKELDGYGSGVGDVTGSGTDGYVTFWTGEKTISGSGDLVFDADDGYLGVGTNPVERLTVNGTIAINEVQSSPDPEDGLGKIYVTNDGKLMFVKENGERYDLTSAVGDIDGGSFTDVYYNTNNFDGGYF